MTKYSFAPNRRGVGIVRGVENLQNLIINGGGGGWIGKCPKIKKLFWFSSKIFSYSSIQDDHISWKFVLDGISSQI